MRMETNTIGSMVFRSILVETKEHLDEFVIKMLVNNELEGLLKLSVLRKNEEMELRYNITSLVPLAQYISTPLSKKQVLTILESMIHTTKEIEEYMLGEQGIAFDVDNIYIDIATGETKFMYFPTENPYSDHLISFMKSLIAGLQFNQNEDCSYVLQMMNAFNNGSIVTASDLQEILDNIEKKTAHVRTEHKVPKKEKAPDVEKVLKQPDIPAENQAVIPKKSNENRNFEIPGVPSNNRGFEIPSGKEEKEEKEEQKSSKSSIFKSNKSDKPKAKLFGKKEKSKKNQEALSIGGNSGVVIPEENDMSGLPLNQEEERSVLSGKENAHMGMDYGNTIMIHQNNSSVTVMISEEDTGYSESMKASVTRVKNNQKMYIENDMLRMGKESDYVDFYIGNNPTISRSHADIIKKNDEYYIRDNNSKNHTYVNEIMAVPGELVKLNNNAKIQLANEEFIFKLD